MNQDDPVPVLVTGGAGLIGAAVCSRLLRCGHRVVATFRRAPPPDGWAGIDWRPADLSQCGALESIGSISAIVHCAALIPVGDADDERVASANRVVDENVFIAARQRECKLVYCSTGGLYGNGRPPRPEGWREDDPVNAEGAYFREKAWAESRGRSVAQEVGIGFTSLRLNAPYGPRQRIRTVIRIFIEQAIAGGPVRYFGSGSRQQDFIHVNDVARAVEAALTAPTGTFNVASGVTVSMRRLAEIVAEQAGLPKDAVQEADVLDPQEDRRIAFDLTRSRRVLGWQPRMTLVEGISDCMAAVVR